MTERRHGPALDQAYIVSPFGPASEEVPRKLRPPPEAANDRLQDLLDHAPDAGLGAELD